MNIQKRGAPDDALEKAETPILYPEGNPITVAKYEDLLVLIQDIDVRHRRFYHRLRTNNDARDVGLASGASDDE